MKKVVLFPALLSLALAFTGVSCSDDDGDDVAKTYSLSVNVTLPAGAESVGDITVTATHAQTAGTYTATIAAGETNTIIAELPTGQYAVSAKAQATASSVYTGSTAVQVYGNATCTIALSEVSESSLIFKEVYVASNNYYFKDLYWEIVNNSNEVQYLDQCIIGSMGSNWDGPSKWVDESGNMLPYYALNGYVLAFPGNGTDYPLQPGESVVIAQDAANHAEAQGDAAYPDLSDADWEAYLTSTSYSDTDYDTPNLIVIYDESASFYFGAGAFGQAPVLVKLPDGVKATDYAADSTNLATIPNSTSTSLYLKIPNQYVLDAIQIADNEEVAAGGTIYPNLLPKDDASYTWATAWGGKSIRRKAIAIDEDGRVRYQDTNNSAEDFIIDAPLTPGIAPTVVD